MATTVTPVSVEEGPPPKSFAERFVGVFFSPRPTFADIARTPNFIPPLIVAVLSSLAVAETMLAKIGMERIVRLSIERSGGASSMTPEQMEQAMHRGASMGAVLAHLGGLLSPPILLLIIAGLGLLIVNGIFGGQIKFPTAFAVTCYANLIGVLGALMGVLLILLGDPEQFNPRNAVPTNLGFFLNPLGTSKPLMAFASSLDIMPLWLIGLLGVGFSEATGRKVKPLSIFAAFFGLWVIWVLGKVGLAMIM